MRRWIFNVLAAWLFALVFCGCLTLVLTTAFGMDLNAPLFRRFAVLMTLILSLPGTIFWYDAVLGIERKLGR